MWEVEEVQPGVGMTLTDRITGERRKVTEKSGSRAATRRTQLLCRVVDFEGTSLLCGSHVRALPPRHGDNVVAQIRKDYRLKGQVPTTALQPYGVSRGLLQAWENEVDIADDQASRRPTLTNTDGDPLLMIVDRFDFDSRDQAAIEVKLSSMKDVQPPPNDKERRYTFVRQNPQNAAMANTIMGSVRIAGTTLFAETNSVARADNLCKALEDACGPLIRRSLREQTAMWKALETGGKGQAASAAEPDIPEAKKQEILRESKARHYQTWPDRPLPALRGTTPRDAVKSAAGRQTVDALLRDMEHGEQSLPAGERYDFAGFRRDLGLEP